MGAITYKVVRHDGGWAYRANETSSDATREAAPKAARVAASEQAAPGQTAKISFEGEKGHWYTQVDGGTDRRVTKVQG